MSCIEYSSLKFHIYNPIEDEIVKTYITFNNLPNNIWKIISNRKFEQNADKLEEYFGSKWKEILSVSITGGEDDDDFVFEDIDENDIKVIATNKDELKAQDYSVKLEYSNVEIYPEDTFFQIYQKIYYITGIPVYRQHVKLNGFIAYSITDNGKDTLINFKDDKLLVAGIHIDGNMATKNNILIYKDYSTALSPNKYFYPKSKDKINEFMITDLDFYKSRMNISTILSDGYVFKEIYYGMVKKYFPIMNQYMFKLYLINEEAIFSQYPMINRSTKYIENMINEHSRSTKYIYNNKEKLKNYYKDNIVLNVYNLIVKINKYKHNNRYQFYMRNILDAIDTSDFINIIGLIYEIDNVKYKITKYRSTIPTEKVKDYLNKLDYDVVDSDTFIYIEYQNMGMSNTIYINEYCHIIMDIHTNRPKESYKSIIDDNLVYLNKIMDIIIKNKKHTIKSYSSLENNTATNKDVAITTSDITLHWNKNINREQFIEFDDLINKYESAEMLLKRNNTYLKTSETHLLKFLRGYSIEIVKIKERPFTLKKDKEIHDYFRIHYDMSIRQLWINRYMGVILNILNKNTYIEFQIEKITDKTFKVVINYLIVMIMEMEEIIKNIPKKEVSNINTKRKMEELDPELYDFEAKDGTKYARICQKKFRPINVFTEEEYNSIDKKDRHIYKFYNYTKKDDIYYECPKKMPYFGFIVGKHPKKYCIPKCKETETSGVKNIQVKDLCHSNHIVDENELDVSDNRNIIKFGKTLDYGRSSYIHESIYNTLKIKNTDDYTVLNLKHNDENKSASYLFYISKFMNITVNDLIDDIYNKFTKDVYNMIISEYSMSYEIMKNMILELKNEDENNIDWTDLISSIIFNIYNIAIITFEVIVIDEKEILNATNSYVNFKINNLVNLNEVDKFYMFIELKNKIYPIIYKSITETYDPVILNNIIKFKSDNDKEYFKKSPFNNYTNLKSDTDIKLIEKYIVSSRILNVLAEYKKNKICIGVNNSYDISDDIKSMYKPFYRSDDLEPKHIIDYIKDKDVDLADLVFLCYKKSINDIITESDKEKCTIIGFRIMDEYFWFKDTLYETIKKMTPIINIEFMPYNTEKIDNLIIKNNPQQLDFDQDKYIEIYYKIHIFDLVKQEIMNIVSRFRRPDDVKFLISEMNKGKDIKSYLPLSYNIFTKMYNSGIIEDRYAELYIRLYKYIMDVGIVKILKPVYKKIINRVKSLNHNYTNIVMSDLTILNLEIDKEVNIKFDVEKKTNDSLFYSFGKINILDDMYDTVFEYIIRDLSYYHEFIKCCYDNNIYIIEDKFKFNLLKNEKIIIDTI